MKKNLVVLIICFYSLSLFCQEQGVIELYDGTSFSGYFKLKPKKMTIWNGEKNATKRKIDLNQIQKLKTINEKGIENEYIFKPSYKKKKKLIKLRLIITGSLNFYHHRKYVNGGSVQMVTNQFFISKKGEAFVTEIRVGSKFKKFEKIVQKYFKDCPDIIPKIWNNFFGDKVVDVFKMVEYYNNRCY